jgi:hypothetical protein
MKKTLAILGMFGLIVASTYAQGWVIFQAGSSAATRISTNSVVGGAATGLSAANDGTIAGTFYYALFYSTNQTTVGGTQTSAISGTNGVYAFNASGWAFASTAFGGAYATNTPSAGRFNSTVADPANSGGTGVPNGAAQQFLVIGWSANIGSTWLAVQSYLTGGSSLVGWVGQSAVSGAITPGSGGLSTPAGLFGGAAPSLQGFILGEVSPIPEPGTLALAALGGASLLMFRRKK